MHIFKNSSGGINHHFWKEYLFSLILICFGIIWCFCYRKCLVSIMFKCSCVNLYWRFSVFQCIFFVSFLCDSILLKKKKVQTEYENRVVVFQSAWNDNYSFKVMVYLPRKKLTKVSLYWYTGVIILPEKMQQRGVEFMKKRIKHAALLMT